MEVADAVSWECRTRGRGAPWRTETETVSDAQVRHAEVSDREVSDWHVGGGVGRGPRGLLRPP